jgi:tetratricopeptide (TPR) repeat protein/transcriptional regulator with XRE-family HTH domain
MAQEMWSSLLRSARKERKWSQEKLAEELQVDMGTVSRWERGERIPLIEHQQKLAVIFGPDVDFRFPNGNAGASGERTQIWNVPFRRNLFFTGREAVLTELYATSNGGSLAVLTHAITGLGGIGKTQTALEYAFRFRDSYETVLWLRATREHFAPDLSSVADLLNLPAAKKQSQDQRLVVRAITRWLCGHSRWLLVLDNLEEDVDVGELLSAAGTGRILITTRVKALADLAHDIELTDMVPEEGALLLLRRAHFIPLGAPLDAATPADREMALKLCREMGGLPLALDLAGAYIREAAYTLARYQEEYRVRRSELLRWRTKQKRTYTDYSESVATTWSLSFQRIKDQFPASIELLRFCAFLSPDTIAENIILSGATVLGSFLQPLASNTELLNQTLAPLLNYSLIRRNAADKLLSIHRLVQVVIQDNLSKKDRLKWSRRTVQAVSIVMETLGHHTPQSDAIYIPHVRVGVTLVKRWNLMSYEASSILHHAGRYLQQHSFYKQAKPLISKALAMRKSLLGPDHPEVADELANLAVLYDRLGQYDRAGSLYQRALAICERSLEPDHPQLAVSLTNLAHWYMEQASWADAEELCRRALSIQEKKMGPDHPQVANSLTTLANIYRRQQKQAEAEPLFQQALAIREKAYEPESIEVAASLTNLAANYADLKKDGEAEPLAQRAKAIFEKILEPGHPYVAADLTILAQIREHQGKSDLAERLYRRAVAIYEQHQLVDHPDTASAIAALAALLQRQAKYPQAEPLMRQALEILQRCLGAEHPLMVHALLNYAVLLRDMGREIEAMSYVGRAQALKLKYEGKEDEAAWHRQIASYLQRNSEDMERMLDREGEQEEL